MSTATVKPTTVRLEEGLKEQATEFLDSVGLSLNSYLNLAVRQLVNQRKIPFEIVGGDAQRGDEACHGDRRGS